IENQSGHPISALNTISTGLRMSNHAASDPIIIGLLVAIAFQAIMDRPFREVLETRWQDPSVMRAAKSVLSQFDQIPKLHHSFLGEVVTCRIIVDLFRKHPEQYRNFRLEQMAIFDDPKVMADAWDARCIGYWRKAFATLKTTEADPI